MTIRLILFEGPDAGRSYELPARGGLLIGRGQNSQARLRDPYVSRRHCTVRVRGERVTVSDSQSVGGTLVNGRPVSEIELGHGDIIQVGETLLRLESDLVNQSTLQPRCPPVEAGPESKAATDAALQDGDIVIQKKLKDRPLPAGMKKLPKLVGQTLGRYQLKRVVGLGQVGVVFDAWDGKDLKRVALKVLNPQFSQDAKQMHRFIRGMQTGRRLRHPNLVTLYNAGKTGEFCWIAMEFIDGESLTELMQRLGVAGQLDWTQAFRLALHMGRALQFAQGRRIIHRNVMPQNILIQRSDRVAKLSDLLLAKSLEETMSKRVSTTKELVGNVYYMSPERTEGGKDSDGRADIYSLGVTLYTLLTGRLPFDGTSSAEVLRKIRSAEPERPKKFQLAIPEPFEGVVLKMLAKQPEQRYQSAADLLADLERVRKLPRARA